MGAFDNSNLLVVDSKSGDTVLTVPSPSNDPEYNCMQMMTANSNYILYKDCHSVNVFDCKTGGATNLIESRFKQCSVKSAML